MVRNNLPLLRRLANRGDRPPSTDSGPPTPLPTGKDRRRISGDDAPSLPGVSKMWFPRADLDLDWQPTSGAVIKILFSVRLSSAIWAGISDCDEVFNYWEPLHLLLYGSGLQTWEYSPVYAIRSWLYVWLEALPARLFLSLLPHSKIAIFITTRCTLAVLSMLADFALYKAVSARLGISIGRFYLAVSMFSAGMFISSSAFLPSSFAMSMNTLAMAALLSNQMQLSTLAVAASSLLGWPFAALLGVPTVLVYIFEKKRIDLFILHSLVALLVIGFPLITVDTWYYGKRVFTPLNIVLYNVFSSHGPDLYGTEPASYYIKNLVLNWNLAAFLWLTALPLSVVLHNRIFTPPGNGKRILGISLSPSYYRRLVPVALLYLSISIWFFVFFAQPHKEERFLFPIYPLIALLTAIALDCIHRLATYFSLPNPAYWILALYIIISASRVLSLHRNYSASLETYKSLNEHLLESQAELDFTIRNDPLQLCVGKEWHRYPSSFFLPSKARDKHERKREVRLAFLESEFRGLLPKYFNEGHIPAITRAIPTEMNDMNKEEPSRYVPLESCDYVVDLETLETTEKEPNLSISQSGVLRPIARHSFLLPQHSHWFFRAFFIPFISESHCTFGHYTLYQRIPPTLATKKRGWKEEEEAT